MQDEDKTRSQLISELSSLRAELAKLRTSGRNLQESHGAHEDEQRLKNLADSLPEAVCEADIEGNILYANDSALRMFGYTREDLESGLNAFDMLVCEERTDAHANTARILAGEDRGWIEHTGLRNDGTTFAMEVHSAAIPANGRPSGFRSIAIDITVRKKVMEDAQRTRERFARLYECAPTAYHTLTSDGRITNVNKKWLRTLGYEKSEVVGQLIFDFIVPSERQDAISSFAAKKADKEMFKRGHERHYLTKSGHVRTFVTNDYFVTNEEGDIVSVHTTLEDITERKRMEQDLRESNMQLSKALEELKRTQQHVIQEERLRALGQIASGVAHDFNNILMPILGLGELALSDPTLLNNPRETSKILGEIVDAAKDAREIVRRMREFYRPLDDSEFRPVDLNKIVESAIQLTKPKWQEETRANGWRIEVRTELGAIPEISGAESQLREVVTNLIFNAIDAIAKTGELIVRTGLEERHVVLDVADTGCGMTEEVRLQCMEPFFTTKGTKGTGMGLAVVHGIVRQHRGSLDVISRPGKGTTIRARFPLPCASDEEPGAEQKEYKPVIGRRILVIEDEPRSRDLLLRYLRADKHAVVTAACGKDGLAAFGKESFDLVITDRAMPDMSGDEVTAQIKALRADTPVVMLTGFGDAMKQNGNMPTGVDMLVGKPVTLKELQQAIADVLSGAVEQ